MKRVIYLICLVAGMAATSIHAAQLPSHYPDDGFDRIGTIETISFETRKIIVNDVEYLLSDDVVLHSRSSSSDSLGRLIKGSKLGFNFTRAGKQRYIREIWLLPSSYTPTEDSIKSYDRPLKPGLLK